MVTSSVIAQPFYGTTVFTGLFLAVVAPVLAADLSPAGRQFMDKHCFECHDTETKKGGLDLTALKVDLSNSANFSTWVLVHDRASSGEMPPKKKVRPDAVELASFLQSLSTSLVSAER